MAKRKNKNNQGIYKKELQNEPLKFLVNSDEKKILIDQANNSNRTQSQYLRYLLLEAPHRTTKEQSNDYELGNIFHSLGYRLNSIAKNANKAFLANETISISTSETIFVDLGMALNKINSSISQIKAQKRLIRDVQIKFLVTPSQLKEAMDKLKLKKLTLSQYMRQQITGHKETKYRSLADEIIGTIGRLNNNINQIRSVIVIEEKAHRLVLITPETKLEIENQQKNISNLQSLLRNN